jgi:hypothetical protein
MENLASMILKGESASQISDAIKSALYAKTQDKIQQYEPVVASNIFTQEEDAE